MTYELTIEQCLHRFNNPNWQIVFKKAKQKIMFNNLI